MLGFTIADTSLCLSAHKTESLDHNLGWPKMEFDVRINFNFKHL